MVATKNLFMLEDRVLQQKGLYAMWTSIFLSNFVVLLTDETAGASRDFNVWANGISVLYCGAAGANNIFGNGLPSTMLLTVGPVHQYAFWHLFAYYGGADVLGQHPIGVMNWIACFLVGFFTVDMIVKTWYVTLFPTKYREYAESAGFSTEGGAERAPVSQDSRV